MSTKYENYTAGTDSPDTVWGTIADAQTFTPSVAHTITSVKLHMYREGSPGTMTVSIRATDGSGHPTGADLCSGTINANDFTTNTDGEWYEITLGAGYALAAGTKYAIVWRCPSGSANNWVTSKGVLTDQYAGGNVERTTDITASPPTWTAYSTYDFNFEEWGNPLAVGRSFGYIIG